MIALPPFGGLVRDQIGNPRIAFPPALVRAAKAVDDGCQKNRTGLVGNVVYLVRGRAERSQEVPFTFHSARQDAAAANAHHLSAAGFLSSLGWARNMSEVSRLRGVGDVDDRSSVALDGAREWVRHLAGVVTHVGDLTPVLIDDDGLVRRTPLQIAVAGQLRVPRGLLIRRLGSRLPIRRGSVQSHGRDRRSIRRVALSRNARAGSEREGKYAGDEQCFHVSPFQSALIPASRTTFAYRADSECRNAPNASGVPGAGDIP